MANEQTISKEDVGALAPANVQYSQRTKLTLKDLGSPQRIATLDVNVNEYFMGTLFGIASGLVSRTDDKTGETYEGLKGEFRSMPSPDELKTGREPLESGVLYIPDAFHSMIASALKSVQAADPNAEVTFAFDVKAIRAKNPAGYSWDFKPKLPAKGANRLDGLYKEVQQLSAPAKQAALAAPDLKAAAKK